MNENYQVQYEKIVKGAFPQEYVSPEEQGKRIQRCSILKSVEIEYGHTNRIQNIEYDHQ